jgi:glutamate synthase domain-containing protein 2
VQTQFIGTGDFVALAATFAKNVIREMQLGIATQDPYLRNGWNPSIGKRRLVNLMRAWAFEIKEMLGGME